MRLIKMLGLAAFASLAAMAFIGASTASAGVHESIGFCLQNEGLLCALTNVILVPAGGSLLVLAHSANAKLENNGFFSTPEECESDAAVKVTEEMKNPLKGSVTSLTFTNCTGPCTTATAQGLPWTNGELKMTSVTGNWDLVSKEGGAELSGCTFGVHCKYGVPAGGSVTLHGKNEAGGAVLKAEGVTLEYQGGSGEFTCGSTGTWTANYAATSIHLKNSTDGDIGLHSPWFFTLLGNTNTES